MKKIVFLGDDRVSLKRNEEESFKYDSYGYGYPLFVASELLSQGAEKFLIFNKAKDGNRVTDLYASVKEDCWNLKPDLISIDIGLNDCWKEIENKGTTLERFEKVFKALIQETKKELPKSKIVIVEPFILKGQETIKSERVFSTFSKYIKAIIRVAREENCGYIPLQNMFNMLSADNGIENYVEDNGIFPTVITSKLIGNEWIKWFNKNMLEENN